MVICSVLDPIHFDTDPYFDWFFVWIFQKICLLFATRDTDPDGRIETDPNESEFKISVLKLWNEYLMLC